MVIDALLAIIVLKVYWKWTTAIVIGLMLPFLAMEVAFLAANSLKVLSGGWVPILLGGALITHHDHMVDGTRFLAEQARRRKFLLLISSAIWKSVHRIASRVRPCF